jgi:hypothetical protein
MTQPIKLHPEERSAPRHGAKGMGVDWECVEFASKGSGVEVEVGHGLGRTPFGAVAASFPGPCIYSPAGLEGPHQARAWTPTKCYFRPLTIPGTIHRFMVF